MRPTPVHGHVYVEPWPAGGYAVWMAGVAAPVSRHDTEQEAIEWAARYQRGLEDAAARGEAGDSSQAASVDDRSSPHFAGGSATSSATAWG
ncbi:MAG: DUF2188 domain-containing protein [Solirubrobacteraceae bacterium]